MGKIGKNGFSLIEVMIALAIFTVFITAYVTSQGQNLADSTEFKKELKLREIAENEINKIIAHPPEFRPALTLTAKTGTVEDQEDYTYTIKYEQMKIPDMKKLTEADGEGEQEESSETNPAEEKVYNNVKKNLEELIWQVEVVIKNKETEQSFALSTWLYNHKAEVMLE